MKRIMIALLLAGSAAAQNTPPAGGGGGGAAAIACAATPGDTTGAYRQQCQTTAGALYVCNNAAGCTVAGDWVSVASPLSLGNAIGGSPTANAILYSDGSGTLQNAPGITRTGPAQLTLGTATNPGNEFTLGTTATDSAALGSELTTSGTCSGTGWTGTYPNYVAPGTTNPLTCTGFTSGYFYQIGATITNNAGVTGMAYASGLSCTGTGTYPLTVTGGSGSGATGTITVTSGVVTAAIAVVTHGTAFTSAPTTGTLGTPTGSASCTGTLVMTSTIGGGTITGAVGTAQTSASSSAASSTYSFSPKANGTSLTYTPTAAFAGTIAVTAKQITPISTFSYTGKDSTGAVSFQALYQGLASLHSVFSGGGGSYNTTGSNNTANGYYALNDNTTGSNNTANGYYALNDNTTGSNNTANGYYALYSNTTGIYNNAQGVSALFSNTTGNSNSAQGYYALYSNTTGNSNSAQGVYALYSNTTGNSNSAQGVNALQSNTTGNSNSAQGVNAGYTATAANANTTGSNNSWFGYNSGPGSPTQYNYQSVIGAAATGTCSNCVVLGRAGGLDTVYAGDAGVDPMVVIALATTPVLTTNLKTCTATTGTPWRASVTDAVAPALGSPLTGGGGGVFANVHCSLTTGTYIVDGL